MNKLITGFSALLLPIVFIAHAQKLPSTQTDPVHAPAGIKIDGKSAEWGDQFHAYNKNIEAFYTIANDDDNLYLVLKAVPHDIADKIIRGGVTLVINHSIKKNDPEAVSVTYPVIRNGDMSAVSNAYARSTYKPNAEDYLSQKQLNEIFESKSKTIAVTSIKAITDKEISVYNQEGVKAAALFDDKNAFVYELAIPLKYLNLPAGENFTYHVKVNEEPERYVRYAGGGTPPPPPPPVAMTASATTDFWGTYTLAKK